MPLSDDIEYALAHAPPTTEWGVVILDPQNNPVYERAAEQPIPAASIAKLGIAHAALQQGLLREDEGYKSFTVRAEDRGLGGTGLLQYFPVGFKLDALDVANLALKESDNVAARMLVHRMGGAAEVNDILRHGALKLEVTQLGVGEEGRFTFGQTSAAETVEMLQRIESGPLATALHETTMWYGLRRYIDERPGFTTDAIGHFLRLAGGVGPSWLYEAVLAREYKRSSIASKGGSLEGSRHDSALINGFSVATLATGYDPRLPYGKKHPAHYIHAQIGAMVACQPKD